MAHPEHVDARRGCYVFQPLQAWLALDLADDRGVFVGVVQELPQPYALEVGVRPTDHDTPLAQGRILRRVDQDASLVGALHVWRHDPQRAQVQGAGHEMMVDLGYAYKRRDGGSFEPGHHVRQVGGAEAAVLRVHDDEIDVGSLEDLRHAPGTELDHHVADGGLLLGQQAAKNVWLHRLTPNGCV